MILFFVILIVLYSKQTEINDESHKIYDDNKKVDEEKYKYIDEDDGEPLYHDTCDHCGTGYIHQDYEHLVDIGYYPDKKYINTDVRIKNFIKNFENKYKKSKKTDLSSIEKYKFNEEVFGIFHKKFIDEYVASFDCDSNYFRCQRMFFLTKLQPLKSDSIPFEYSNFNELTQQINHLIDTKLNKYTPLRLYYYPKLKNLNERQWIIDNLLNKIYNDLNNFKVTSILSGYNSMNEHYNHNYNDYYNRYYKWIMHMYYYVKKQIICIKDTDICKQYLMMDIEFDIHERVIFNIDKICIRCHYEEIGNVCFAMEDYI